MKKIDISLSLDSMDFHPSYRNRILNNIQDEEAMSIGELCMLSPRELRRFRNMGNLCITSIVDTLKSYGLRLGMSQSELDSYMQDQNPNYLLLKAIDWDKRVLDLAKEIYLAMPTPRTHDSALQAFTEAQEFYEVAKSKVMPDYLPNQ